MSKQDDPLALAALAGREPGGTADAGELAAASRVVEAVDAAPLPEGPSAAALQRTFDAVMAEWPAGQSWGARLRALLFPTVAVAASATLALLLARPEGTVAFATWHCAPGEMAFGLLPFALALMVYRRRGGQVGAASMAGWAAAGALVGQIAMLRLCHGRDLSHLLSFHAGGVLASAVAGALVSRPFAWWFARASAGQHQV